MSRQTHSQPNSPSYGPRARCGLAWLVVGALVLTGCVDDHNAGQELALGDATLFWLGVAEDTVLAADGSASSGAGEVFGKISADGKFTDVNGSVAMELQPNGYIRVGEVRSRMRLTKTGGLLLLGGEVVTIGFPADGTVTGVPALGHEGCSGAMAKTCAFVLAGMTDKVVAAAAGQ